MNLATKAYLKWLWLSKTYPFLWVHKPLCNSYKEDTISAQGVHLCRSCVFTYLGITVGCSLTAFTALSANTISALLVALLLLTLPLSHPAIYKTTPRFVRDILRFNLGAIISFSLLLPICHQKLYLPLISTGISIIFWKIYYQKRSIRKIKFCENCSEYRTGKICSGYILQAGLVREYEEKATEIIYKNGYTPKVLRGK